MVWGGESKQFMFQNLFGIGQSWMGCKTEGLKNCCPKILGITEISFELCLSGYGSKKWVEKNI